MIAALQVSQNDWLGPSVHGGIFRLFGRLHKS